jgi:hypothetical protein
MDPKEFENLTHEQAQAKIAVLPAQMVYEARFALQRIKEIGLNEAELIETVEPLARAIGWAEALVFAFDKTTERDAVKSLVGNGVGQLARAS